jgi:hypothetical protein
MPYLEIDARDARRGHNPVEADLELERKVDPS